MNNVRPQRGQMFIERGVMVEILRPQRGRTFLFRNASINIRSIKWHSKAGKNKTNNIRI